MRHGKSVNRGQTDTPTHKQTDTNRQTDFWNAWEAQRTFHNSLLAGFSLSSSRYSSNSSSRYSSDSSSRADEQFEIFQEQRAVWRNLVSNSVSAHLSLVHTGMIKSELLLLRTRRVALIAIISRHCCGLSVCMSVCLSPKCGQLIQNQLMNLYESTSEA